MDDSMKKGSEIPTRQVAHFALVRIDCHFDGRVFRHGFFDTQFSNLRI